MYARKPCRINNFRILLTEKCNFQCTYCFESGLMDIAPHMTLEVLEGTVKAIIEASPCERVSIQWFGGEPLLRWNLIAHGMDLFEDAVAEKRISGVNYSLTTNGSLATPAIAERMARESIQVFVSVDGPQDVNDLSRIDRLGRGTYDRAIQGYRTLADHGVDVGLLVTVSPETLSGLSSSIAHLIESEGLRRIGINTPQPTENGWDVDGALLASEIVKIIRFCDERGVKLIAPGMRALRGLGTKTPHVDDCRAPGGEMAVSVDTFGRMSGCIVSWVEGRPWNKDEITHQSLARFEMQKSASTVQDVCDGCIAEAICGGPCHLELALRGLNPERCAFYQTLMYESLMSLRRFNS
ncbi:radical SAM protein [Cutibacterium sp. WCA-380-WT-3A]|uniref:Radical SAM protein n=1 Tax=Cutibacterium porci TaxID=2605781 RepID=A0A7K0J4X8_9ACTN|nr:radical SAM protein [Cutibacterium porci]